VSVFENRSRVLVMSLGLCAMFAAVPNSARAQNQPSLPERTIAISAVGLVSFQPVDDSYVGPPYLDVGLGGVGPGAGIGVALIRFWQLSPAFEVSTAYLHKTQSGRLVPDGPEGKLHDVLVSALLGMSNRSGTFYWRAGPSWVDGSLVHGVDIYEGARLALTGGVDFTSPRSKRFGWVATMRYSFVQRSSSAIQLGIGSHVVRGGVGIRWLQ